MLERWFHNHARTLERLEHRLIQDRSMIMAAIDDLKAAVDNAVAEMNAAVDALKNHPATSNDQELSDLAHRLQSAADALHGADQSPDSSTTSGEVPPSA